MNCICASGPSAVTTYLPVGDEVLGETGPNGTMYYHTDALGSVTMTTNSSGAVLNEYRYKPYGAQLSKSGTAPDPKFTWAGTRGYRQTGLVHSDVYVRNRHYASAEARWTSVAVFSGLSLPNQYVFGPSGVTTLVARAAVSQSTTEVDAVIGAMGSYSVITSNQYGVFNDVLPCNKNAQQGGYWHEGVPANFPKGQDTRSFFVAWDFCSSPWNAVSTGGYARSQAFSSNVNFTDSRWSCPLTRKGST
jgi:hypothetical protein